MTKYLGNFILLTVAILTLMGLLYEHRFGTNGTLDHKKLKEQISAQKQLNEQQSLKNAILKADVIDLKTGFEAVEEHARLDLGLIKPKETFVQLSTAPIVQSRVYKRPSTDPRDSVEAVPEYLPNFDTDDPN